MNLAKYLWLAGSAVAGALGSIHLLYTFFSNKFLPRNGQLMEEMKKTSPVISRDLTMWNAWVGFNGSHSIGIIFISVLNIYIGLILFPVFQKKDFYFLLNIATMLFYVFLASKYWFSKPLIGVCIVLGCYLVSYILVIVNR
ncbi:MAG: hypothetical protein INR73_20780 [Williamsia sp.]|nr:hypothetical protein [Williamsia sp.]